MHHPSHGEPPRGHPVPIRLYSALANAWGLGIGFLAVAAAVIHFFFPNAIPGDPAVTATLGGWDEVYFAMYGAAGAMILYGLLRPKRAVDVFGLCLLAAGLTIAFIASLQVYPLETALAASGPSYVALFGGALGRIAVQARFVRPCPPKPDRTLPASSDVIV